MNTDKLLKQARRLVDKIKKDEKLWEEYRKLPIPGTDDWVEVGTVGVDAGMVWIGDPCYILALPHTKGEKKFGLGQPKELPKTLGEDWGEFCDKMHEPGEDYPSGSKEFNAFLKKQIKKGEQKGQRAVQFNYEMGHPGLGVCLGSGYGDGSYPVYVKRNKEGRITEAKIVFIEEDEDEE